MLQNLWPWREQHVDANRLSLIDLRLPDGPRYLMSNEEINQLQ